jgi:plasmid stabilization system protein ParE
VPENKIRWYEAPKKQFTTAIQYIMDDSVQNAVKIETRLFKKLEAVSKSPTMCPPDKYKINNDGSYRAFSLFHYRVSYRIKGNEIRILRFRHTSMKPKYY